MATKIDLNFKEVCDTCTRFIADHGSKLKIEDIRLIQDRLRESLKSQIEYITELCDETIQICENRIKNLS